VTNSTLNRSVVLIVDDHPDTLRLLIDALEEAGVTVLIATNGKRALEQVKHLLPDLILLDAVMSGMDGFQTCRVLKSGVAADVPVIFMTGLEETEHIVRGLEAGGIDYLTKPITPDELIARMRVQLARAREVQGARTALDMSGRTMLAANARGEIKWATPQAQQILAKLGVNAPDATAASADTTEVSTPAIGLPPQVRAWLTRSAASVTPSLSENVVVAAHNLRIRFRLLSRISDDEVLLVIQQAEPAEIERAGIGKLQNRLGLTSREAEVLFWLSNGKSNRDIADILGISYRTVDKHLENLFAKIGIESRSGAVATAVHILDE